jgi:Coenzyme PQQ synthesis protein D (PqqD)
MSERANFSGDEMQAKVRINSARVMHEKIEGEVIAIDLSTGSYYSLRDVGAQIWALIERTAAADEIVAALEAEYESANGDIENHVRTFLDELAAEGLVELGVDQADDSPPANQALPPSAERKPFARPVLEKHTDMQDLILLDPVHEVDARGWPHTAEEARE